LTDQRIVVSPHELEAILRARVDRARPQSPVREQTSTKRRRLAVPRGVVAFIAASAIMVIGVVIATGATFINLTTVGSSGTANGGIFLQGGTGAGTGNFDPFLTLNTQGNQDTEKGVNVCITLGCPAPQFDTFTGGGRTHALQVAAIPVIEYNGADYRQFSLDANDSGTDPFMSVDAVKIFIDNQSNLGGYNNLTETFATNQDGSAAVKIYDLGDNRILMSSQELEPGSGVSDITLLVPNERFNELFPECFYGSLDCNQWLYFYTESGGVGTGAGDGRDYNVTAGFEEWQVQLLPVVNVAKTAVPSFDRSYTWDVAKSADGGLTELNIFAGQSTQIDWTVTATASDPQDSNFALSGEITITNPTGGDVISEPIPAEIASVEDVVTIGAVDTAANVDCGVTFPITLAPGDDLVCTYDLALDGGSGTNVATATLNLRDKQGTIIDTLEYSGSADFDFANADPNVSDDCVTVTDDNATPGDTGDDLALGEACVGDSPKDFPVSTDVGPFAQEDCTSSTVTNTGYIETNTTHTTGSASASVDVNCYVLSVSKDAITSLDRNYDWEIAKTRVIVEGEVDGDGLPGTLTLEQGQVYTVTYEVTVNVTGFTDDNRGVHGTITIDNPAPMDAVGVEVSDEISGFGAAAVDCDPATAGDQTSVDVPAEGSAECSYSASDLPDETDRVNTATAALFGEEYIGTADVLFDENTVIGEIDECIDVVDDQGTADTSDDVALGTVCVGDVLPFTFQYTIEVGPFECGQFTFTNTASFQTTDDENDTDESGSSPYTITIDVPCPQGCTLTQGYWKTHNDSFKGGAPTDETWALIGPDAEQTTFFLSGQSYFDVMWTAPKGNAYYQLAKQYIAAQLNVLAGADDSAIATAFSSATTLFNTYTPAQVGALKGNNAIRQQFISLAGTLGSYNEGLIGPGHCDEDGGSSATASITLAVADRRETVASA
jgi:hypothetical protein